jgi:hypothetical protein
VLIEKPTRGDFLPVLDGGYALQYAPLLEYREGKGRMLLCQLDVTGRSERDAAAEVLAGNVLRYVAGLKREAVGRRAVYAGEEAGIAHLKAAGFEVERFAGQELTPAEHVLVVGPGGGKVLGASVTAVAGFVKAGGHVLGVGLDQSEISALVPQGVTTARREHIAATFAAAGEGSALAGVCPADVHNRDPREVPLVTGGGAATPVGGGVLANVPGSNVVLCQLAPWQFAEPKTANLRRTQRRVSFLLARLLSNAGVAATTPLLDRFATAPAGGEARYLEGLYLDRPEEWDDPYRFFRW